MTAQDFAASVWFHAGSEALRLAAHERSAWLEKWQRFALWDDELDQIFLGRATRDDDRRRIDAELKEAAAHLISCAGSGSGG